MYKLLFDKEVLEDLSFPTKEERRFIFASLQKLASYYSDAYERELEKSGVLKRLDGEWDGFFRLRLRTFRAIFKRYGDSIAVYVIRSRQRKDIER